MTYYIYMVRCSDNTLYTGITTDLIRRVKEHNGIGKNAGAKYTASRQPVTLVYSRVYPTRSEALIAEAQVKKLSKIEKEKLLRDP